ncbi:SDR family oxidoreductase [Limnoglobus roseus]|uniref:KR domain-containing protein n=1 Tax=Limnoglobus roseus TaxID=2598579 RepID=A0A5C1AN45_9BACT|nr:SDR family oxidoreductase [Limnoglobus roseus]QEL20651.1 KR domain-containing protein [Limnoglobus roseus]
MSHTLKPLSEQVIVLTGATSGIGLATARAAARRGAKLVLAARNDSALRQLAQEIESHGGRAVAVRTDVGVEGEVRDLGRQAVEAFGAVDTWVNNAGGSIYGPMKDVSTDDHRRLFETNFWGVVYGSLEAARHFRTRTGPAAGVLVNVGSVLSDRAIPVQGMYCASKHAVKGFTDALRMELEEEGVPAVVTLVKPSSIDTPFPQRARNYMDEEPTLPPPLYTPGLVARTILHCAEHPERDVTVGGGGKAIAMMGAHAPRLTDHVMAATLSGSMKKGQPPRHPAGTLTATSEPELKERGEYSGPVFDSSLYTAAALHPVLTAALAVGAGALVAALTGGAKSSRS